MAQMKLKRILTDVDPADAKHLKAAFEAEGGVVQVVEEAAGKRTVIATFPGLPAPTAAAAPAASNEAKWMKFANAEIGTKETAGSGSNPAVEKYHKATSPGSADDSIPWCSSFVNWCVIQAGFQGTGSRLARSWLQWGHALTDPVPGCIVVLKRGDPPKGHVGFFAGLGGGEVKLLGGNQSDEVNISNYRDDRVIGYRTA